MIKWLSSIWVLVLFSCGEGKEKESSPPSIGHSEYQWTDEDRTLFFTGCYAKAKDQVGPEQGEKYCKCMLEELQSRFPSMDSSMSVMVNDQNLLAELVEKCRK